jgi:flagellar biosynthesis chaperone FliJ
MSVGGKDKIKRESENSLARLKEKRERDAKVRQAEATQQVHTLVKKLESIMGKDKLQLAVEPTLPVEIQTDRDTDAFSDFAQFLEKEINKKKLN